MATKWKDLKHKASTETRARVSREALAEHAELERIKYKSDAFEAIHSTVAAMHKAGIIDKETMRTFNESCLTVPDSMEPAQCVQDPPSHEATSQTKSLFKPAAGRLTKEKKRI
jgi:hypothetical protein